MPYTGRENYPYYQEELASPSALWSDLYALTMAQALWEDGRHNAQSTFHGFIRTAPYDGQYLLTAGQNIVLEWMDKNWKFDDADIYTLAKKTIPGPDGQEHKLFKPEFLKMLKDSQFELTVDAMPEGELAFPAEPIFRVNGPLWQGLMVEAAILNTTNSQSNFATYASHLKTAAGGAPILEFGLRRSQGVGGLSSSRGAFVGGADISSNVWAERCYDIPTKGTMAHAFIMCYEDELTAFKAWANGMPYNGIFLVDTYDTLHGVENAINVCKENGLHLSGIRLDSGDLSYLSKEARKLLDAAGFGEAKITASNDLDRATINALKQDGAKIDYWTVGTALVTAKEQPGLGGVYKIGAIFDENISAKEVDAMRRAVRNGKKSPDEIRKHARELMKLSGDAIKMSYPGELDIVRYLKSADNGALYFDGGTILSNWQKDPIKYNDPKDEFSGILTRDITSIQRDNATMSKDFEKGTQAYHPLQRFFTKGKLTGNIETVHQGRERGLQRMAMLEESHKRQLNPHRYVVGAEEDLNDRQMKMARKLRNTSSVLKAQIS